MKRTIKYAVDLILENITLVLPSTQNSKEIILMNLQNRHSTSAGVHLAKLLFSKNQIPPE